MCVRPHPGAQLEGRKRRRIPSGRPALVTNWERHTEWPYRMGERWIPQLRLWCNTHCGFRHLGNGSPYLGYVKLVARPKCPRVGSAAQSAYAWTPSHY